MKYCNPVITADCSDPDVIRVGDDFYMVSSSYNYVPGIPVLHSKNLVEWRLINYVIPELPFEKHATVCHGDGAGAPSLRFHGGKFYCLVPFPGEGIFVSETQDPFDEWSPLRPLIEREGLKDPCPVWADGKCFIVFAFDDSYTGVHSQLAVFEADEQLTKADGKFTLIYDGRNHAPWICTPKIYRRNNYYYILASAGGTVGGWQVALRAKSIYGPYESKVIAVQGNTDVNGPNRGCLVDLDGDGEKWAYLHVQNMGAYGSVLHLQPAVWHGDWVLCGQIFDNATAGVPAPEGDYPVDIETDYAIAPSDEFEDGISPLWQNPANLDASWCEIKRGFKLNCVYYGVNALSGVPQLFLQKVPHLNFSVKTKCRLNLVNDGDEVGFVMFGKAYSYICVVRRDGRNYLEIRKGEIGGSEDETLCQSQPYDDNYVTFQMSAKYQERHKLTYKYTFGGSAFTHKFFAEKDVRSGTKMGIYARSNSQSKGSATFKFFRVVCTDKRVSSD